LKPTNCLNAWRASRFHFFKQVVSIKDMNESNKTEQKFLLRLQAIAAWPQWHTKSVLINRSHDWEMVTQTKTKLCPLNLV